VVGGGSVLNHQIAERLREMAELLEQQRANPFRLAAYRRAAETIAGLREEVAALLEREGIKGLDALPGIGPVLAQAIAQMVRTGRWAQLERLRGAVAPEQLFQSIPGVGLDSHAGSISTSTWIRWKRLKSRRTMVAWKKCRASAPGGRRCCGLPSQVCSPAPDPAHADPRAGSRSAPRRRSRVPAGSRASCPTEDHALFSNTARAHELGRSRDWG